MTTLVLSAYNTKRLLKHKRLNILFVALPVVAGLLRILFTKWAFALSTVWLCPLACILVLGVILYTQWAVDATSGLIDGLRSCRLSMRTISASRVLSGASIFAAQMVVFALIMAIRFR
ncbi:MAG: hypothetical protein ACOX3G_02115 [Armatimonadota bacterium]|jgi:thiosulfate reductase cytochrome b subunit